MNLVEIDTETRRQIDELEITQGPLILCDVDEVALHFVAPFEAHLRRNGFELIARSYGLTGNIVEIAGQTPATQDTVRDLLLGFFDTQIGEQSPVDGVAAALSDLRRIAEIVMLTNIPAKHRDARREALARHGIPYPVVTNNGPKGPAARVLSERAGGAVFFLDDSPSNVRSVRDCVTGVELIHFIADKRFFDLAAPIDGVHLRANDWKTVTAHILDRLTSP